MSCPYAHCDFFRLCLYVGFLGRATYDGKEIEPNGYNCLSISYYTRSLNNVNRLYEIRADGDSGKIVYQNERVSQCIIFEPGLEWIVMVRNDRQALL